MPPRSPCSAYQADPDRVYGMAFAGFDIRFTVSDGVLTVRDIIRTASEKEAHI